MDHAAGSHEQADGRPPKTARRRFAWAALLAAPSLVAAGTGACGPTPEESPPLLLLISIDTLRADRLGCYGYPAGATPTIDALAEGGVLFEAAMAPTPLTGPSHATLHTGLIPPHHGVHVNTAHVLPDEVRTLAEALRDGGFQTGAFVSGLPLQRESGLQQGFDHYDDTLQPRAGPPGASQPVERYAGETLTAARDWLATTDSTRPVFAFVHLFDPHLPHERRLPGAAGVSYDGEIAYVDRELGSFLSSLRGDHRGDHMLTVLTSDHGESLGEHGENTHGYFVYESTLHVPLLVHAPGRIEPRRIPTPVSLADIAPTILELAGLPGMRDIDGVSLVPCMAGTAPPVRPLYFESLLSSLVHGWAPLRGIRRGDLKYIAAPRPELYDLGRDPREENDLWGRHSSEATAMVEHLGTIEDRRFETRELDQDTLRKLEALGYAAVPATPSRPGTDALDPKDGLVVWMGLQAAQKLYLQGRCAEALAAIEEFAPPCRNSADYHLRRGLYASGSGNLELAVTSYRRCLALDPRNQAGRLNLGAAYARLERLKEALDEFETLLEINPDNMQAHLKAADLCMRFLHDDARAIAHMKRFLELAPDHPKVGEVREVLARLLGTRRDSSPPPPAEGEGDKP